MRCLERVIVFVVCLLWCLFVGARWNRPNNRYIDYLISYRSDHNHKTCYESRCFLCCWREAVARDGHIRANQWLHEAKLSANEKWQSPSATSWSRDTDANTTSWSCSAPAVWPACETRREIKDYYSFADVFMIQMNVFMGLYFFLGLFRSKCVLKADVIVHWRGGKGPVADVRKYEFMT